MGLTGPSDSIFAAVDTPTPERTTRGPSSTACLDRVAGYFDSDHEFFCGCFADLIDWGTAAHPAAALPAALSLVSLTAIHPDAERIRAVLDALGETAVGVEAGPAPALRVVLR
jgi:hypothetical protein